MPSRRAVFLDRDGVIVREVGYLRRASQLKVLRGVPAAIARLRRAGYKVVVASNQSAIGRGWLTKAGLTEIHRTLKRMLEDEGAKLDAIFFCPHHPDEKCSCRKPATGMLDAAKKRFRLDMSASYMVGDSTTDVQAAKNAGLTAVLVRTGKGGKDGRYGAKADRVVRGLPEAADWILGKTA